MPRVGYYSPETAQLVLDVVQYLQRAGFIPKKGIKSPAAFNNVHACIFKTPTGGIPKRSGTTSGSAECTAYRVDTAGELVTVKDNSGVEFVQTVYHIAESGPVAGDTYIQAKRIFGQWIADMEDCS